MNRTSTGQDNHTSTKHKQTIRQTSVGEYSCEASFTALEGLVIVREVGRSWWVSLVSHFHRQSVHTFTDYRHSSGQLLPSQCLCKYWSWDIEKSGFSINLDVFPLVIFTLNKSLHKQCWCLSAAWFCTFIGSHFHLSVCGSIEVGGWGSWEEWLTRFFFIQNWKRHGIIVRTALVLLVLYSIDDHLGFWGLSVLVEVLKLNSHQRTLRIVISLKLSPFCLVKHWHIS